jgi:ATP-dependent Clp protease ATP-binding subunit ClpA
MFERFTERARRVVVLAQEEARRLHHNYIGTEHILLGLIREGEGVAALALDALGISLDAVRQQVEEIIGQSPQEVPPPGHIPFTPRAKKVLELSLRESLDMGHNYIGTEHILLGLVREGEGVAAQVLGKLGARLDRVRAKVNEMVKGVPEVSSPHLSPIHGPGPFGSFASRLDDMVTRIEALSARLDEVTSRLDVMAERLTPGERAAGKGTPASSGSAAGTPAKKPARRVQARRRPDPPTDEPEASTS